MPDRQDNNATIYFHKNGIIVKVASNEYLLAMKNMSTRQSSNDINDGAILFNKLKLKDADDIILNTEKYYKAPHRQQLMFANTIYQHAKRLKHGENKKLTFFLDSFIVI
jgi:hypothetical protein